MMTRTNILMTSGILVMVVFLAAAPALGQYQVPLRYDLRYSNPGYIPSDSLRYAPPENRGYDPYAFGSVPYGNLGLTGNLRQGRSFQGNVPYNQQGSQMSNRLPSLALSNFRRDSLGIEDVGTGVEFGQPTAYFPGSGSVTNLGTATNRFAVPPPGNRAPYTTPSLNKAYAGPPSTTGADDYYARVLAPGTGTIGGVPLGTTRLTIPKSALEYVDALIEGRANAKSLLESQNEQDKRIGLLPEPADHRIGIERVKKSSELTTEAAVEQAKKDDFEASQSALYWRLREENKPSKTLQQLKQEEQTPAVPPATKPMLPPTPVPPGSPDEVPPPAIPAAPERYVPGGGYADYFQRASAAMRESDFGKAEALYSAAATLEPEQPLPVFGRINALLGRMLYAHAALLLERALKAHPDWAAQVPDLNTVYAKPELLERILTDLNNENRDQPQNVSTWLLLGYVHFATGQYAEAKPFLLDLARTRNIEPGPEQGLLKVIEAKAAK